MIAYISANYFLFIIPGILLGLYAQWKVSSTYKKYVQVASNSGMTGAQAARAILDGAGLTEMPIHVTGGHLTDHYDPVKRQLVLSEENYHGRSVAGIAVAAHEAGHALQHKAAYAPLTLRMAVVPMTQFATSLYIPVLLLGLFMGLMHIALPVVIAIFTILAVFQLITLPVEYDASARAKEQLLRMGLVPSGEIPHVAKVLNAAALTYVAALVSTLFTLAYYLLMAQGRD